MPYISVRLKNSTVVSIIAVAILGAVTSKADGVGEVPLSSTLSPTTHYFVKVNKYDLSFRKVIDEAEASGGFDLYDNNKLIFVNRCGRVDFMMLNGDLLQHVSSGNLPDTPSPTFCKSKPDSLANAISGVRNIAYSQADSLLYVLKTTTRKKTTSCENKPFDSKYGFKKNICTSIVVERYKVGKDQTIVYKDLIFRSTEREFKYTSWTQLGGGMSISPAGDMYFAIGDFGFLDSGYSVTSKNTFGKVYRLDHRTQKVSVFASGNRNPSGLSYRNNVLYGVDHGPKGGDEINVINLNDDLGWPGSSYGINYDNDPYQDATYSSNHDKGKRPLFAFLADIGLNSIDVMPANTALPAWGGDIFVAGLSTPELKRIRLYGDKVEYVESIPVMTNRIRSIKISNDGTIFALSDEKYLSVIKRATR